MKMTVKMIMKYKISYFIIEEKFTLITPDVSDVNEEECINIILRL